MHLVAYGFSQIYGVNYLDTYSPIAQLASICAILAIAARNNWEIDTFDFNRAYLNGELNEGEEIYMQLPSGYQIQGENTNQTLKLLKSLYRLKQAGWQWYEVLICALAEIGLITSSYNPGIFHTRVRDKTIVLAIHVDNCIITGSL